MILRDLIVNGEWEPGTRLTEKQLEQDLQVSRSVVRESLRQLESESLITLVPNVGPVVASLSREATRELYEVRAALEGMAANLASLKASDSDIEVLRTCADTLPRQVSDLRALIAAKNDFYDVLFRAADNSSLLAFHRNIQARISLMRSQTLQAPGRLARSRTELQELVAAISNRQPEAAERLARLHVEAAQALALAGFDEPTTSV